MNVKYKKLHPLAQAPIRANDCDAGFDLTAIALEYPSDGDSSLYIQARTGISFEIPKGYVGLVFPRSSISKTRHALRNAVGVIDSGYRGEVMLRFSHDQTNTGYAQGDKVGQIIFIKLPKIEMLESEVLSDSERGQGGFGSTGK
jgi:dUTP pyrophosphatase